MAERRHTMVDLMASAGPCIVALGLFVATAYLAPLESQSLRSFPTAASGTLLNPATKSQLTQLGRRDEALTTTSIALIVTSPVVVGLSSKKLIDTPLGQVEVKEYGSKGDGAPVIAFHGMMAKKHVVEEWDRAAQDLAARGHWVLVPNLHSNRKTKPRAISDDGFASVAKALIDYASPSLKRAVLMGKSWGGKQVLKYAGEHKGAVEKIVLVAPAVAMGSELVSKVRDVPVLLCWAEDDVMVPFKNADAFQGLPNVKLVTAKTGGHKVVPSYSSDIVSFLDTVSPPGK